MKTPSLLALTAAVALSSCTAPDTYVRGDQINVIGYPVHRAVELLPLEMTPEQVLDYQRLQALEAERNKSILDGRVNNVRGW
ncbi:hypothetical protein H6768_02350 [Candidatus Peribacteria bacterium]|nr:hypothetical protein [Candidatus Peribacteria bacterium]